jgi:phosphatidylglycerophosphatase A
MPVVSTPLLLFLIVLFSALGVWGAGKYSRDRGLSDPSEVIVDEAVGVWISMLGHVTSVAASGYLLPALFLFRVFDILKPIPVSTAEKLPGGLGIMADDVVAGVLANLLLWAFRWIFIGDGFVRLFG